MAEKPKIFRIEVTPEVFRIVESEAFLQCVTMKDIASKILAEHCSKEAKDLANRRSHVLIKPNDHRDEKPFEQESKEPECGGSEHSDHKPKRKSLTKDPELSARILELAGQGVGIADISRKTGIARSTISDFLKRSKEAGEESQERQPARP